MARGNVELVYEPFEWEEAVGRFTTLDFTGFPNFTFITDQFVRQGVVFMDGDDFIDYKSTLYPNDGVGLAGGATNINVEFDPPQSWFAVDFPGILRIRVFSTGELIFTELAGGGGPGFFAGILAIGHRFDRIELDDPFGAGGVFIDDLHFGGPPPGDANLDDVVDVDDLILVILNWGTCPDERKCLADPTGDGFVDVDDLLEVILNWSQAPL